jgi:hypothetical protein
MKIIDDPAELAPFSEDYGRQSTQPPKLVVKPLTLNAWPRARHGDMMLALGVFYYLGRAQAQVMVNALRATRDDAMANLGGQPYFMDGLPHDWRPLLGDERLTRVQAVLHRADPHRVFARLPGL